MLAHCRMGITAGWKRTDLCEFCVHWASCLAKQHCETMHELFHMLEARDNVIILVF